VPFARKRFGQHFLEPAWARKVVDAIGPGSDEAFIEIGPGRGALTRPLAAAAGSVTAFEIDRDLASALRTSAAPNVQIVQADFLQVAADHVRSHVTGLAGPLRVAGNLPYNVAAPIVFALLRLYGEGLEFLDATVMLQREVADRLLAAPGSRDYGTLTVLVRHGADVTRLLSLPPGAFRPAPKVHSSVVRLRFHPPSPPVADLVLFRRLVQAVFSQRRKTLKNALEPLAAALNGSVQDALERAGIDGSLRPEALNLDEFTRLSDAFTPAG
jgi:16S rRNA (adenine1518-N6/adenine1519-N6)-dimethyltransferase